MTRHRSPAELLADWGITVLIGGDQEMAEAAYDVAETIRRVEAAALRWSRSYSEPPAPPDITAHNHIRRMRMEKLGRGRPPGWRVPTALGMP